MRWAIDKKSTLWSRVGHLCRSRSILYVFPWTPSWLSTDWLLVSRLQAPVSDNLLRKNRQMRLMQWPVFLEVARAHQTWETPPVCCKQSFFRCKWIYREEVFTFDILQVLFLLCADQAKFMNLQKVCMSGHGRCQLQASCSTSTCSPPRTTFQERNHGCCSRGPW